MGARMMRVIQHIAKSGRRISYFVMKESAYLLNFGYQGIMSTIDASGY
jgi:glycine C-acetyltransferase